MRKQNIFKALILMSAAAFVLTFGSCKKDPEVVKVPDVQQPTPETKTDLLTSSGWVMKSVTVKIFGQDFNFLDDCQKDDILTFITDGTITYDEGSIQCDSNDLRIDISGTWAFASNETKLVVESDGEIQTLDIVSLTSTDMKLTQTQFDSTLNTERKVTAEFTH